MSSPPPRPASSEANAPTINVRRPAVRPTFAPMPMPPRDEPPRPRLGRPISSSEARRREPPPEAGALRAGFVGAAAARAGLAAAGFTGFAAAGRTGLAAAGFTGFAAAGRTGLAAAGRTGLAAAGLTGFAAAGRAGFAGREPSRRELPARRDEEERRDESREGRRGDWAMENLALGSLRPLRGRGRARSIGQGRVAPGPLSERFRGGGWPPA